MWPLLSVLASNLQQQFCILVNVILIILTSKIFIAAFVLLVGSNILLLLILATYYKIYGAICGDCGGEMLDSGGRQRVYTRLLQWKKRLHRFGRKVAYPSAFVYSFIFVVGLWMSASAQDVFQIYQPVLVTDDGVGCAENVLLMDHVFTSSYGKPFVGNYEPPACEFDTVHMNLTVTSRGKQFDRLAILYLGDSEVFRTSTAEPTKDGIIWTYTKDMSPYNALWEEPQKLIFDLGNTITDKYTGAFHAMLTASFSHGQKIRTADMIMPISARKSGSNSSSAFNAPSDNTTVYYKFPASASRAIVSISACGQATEEFWWSNVFSSDTETFNSSINKFNGFSPFREVQLLIDGVLAGVVWPFPIIFTGGVVPGFWRPIVGIDAFDLRQPEIDITPFLPLLTDQREHSFEIKVIGLHFVEGGAAVPSSSVGAYWVVTGNIFVYLSDDNGLSSLTNVDGSNGKPQVITAAPAVYVARNLIKGLTGRNESLSCFIMVERTLNINSSQASWSQKLSYFNFGLTDHQGLNQITNQSTSGTNTATMNGKSADIKFEYPLFLKSAYDTANDSEFTIHAQLKRGLAIEATGGTGISTYTLNAGPSRLHTEQWGVARFHSNSSGNSTSFGDTTSICESSTRGGYYYRSARSINGSIVCDTDSGVRVSS